MPRLNLWVLLLGSILPLLASCSVMGTSTGPSRRAVEHTSAATLPGLRVEDITEAVATANVRSGSSAENFAEALGGAEPVGTRVGVGDTLAVTIWEASPPALFGAERLDSGIGSGIAVSQPNTLSGMQVGPSGTITIPFAGEVPAAGRTLRQIEQEIVRRLQGKAHLPQAQVRIERNVTTTVAVLGDVKNPGEIPLTPHGERILDALSEAGGTSEPLDRMTVQITRGPIVRRIAARDLIADPRNNVVLKSGDVVTALYQPYSFTVLGAAGKNDEVRFEGVGLSLSQALGRIGGLAADRADSKGVFIFRWEHLAAAANGASVDPSDAVPVIYRADLKDPATYFAAQRFRMRDGDVLYVSNSSVADLQRFVNLIASSILPFSAVKTITQ
jgi:polysaccharide export outer membrane protein